MSDPVFGPMESEFSDRSGEIADLNEQLGKLPEARPYNAVDRELTTALEEANRRADDLKYIADVWLPIKSIDARKKDLLRVENTALGVVVVSGSGACIVFLTKVIDSVEAHNFVGGVGLGMSLSGIVIAAYTHRRRRSLDKKPQKDQD